MLRAGCPVRVDAWGRCCALLVPSMLGRLVLTALAVLVLAFGAALVSGQPMHMGAAVAWGVALVLTCAMAGLAYRVAVVPLLQLVRQANRLAAGDLTQRVNVKHSGVVGDLEKALAQLGVNLQSVVRDARDESDKMQVATARLPRTTATCRPAPRRRRPTWRKPPHRWSRSPAPSS